MPKPSSRKTEAKNTVAVKPNANGAAKPSGKGKKPVASKEAEESQNDSGSNDSGSNDSAQAASTGDILGLNRSLSPEPVGSAKLKPFLKKQQVKLLNLRDAILDSMMGVAKDNLRSRAEGSEASAFGMHQADAGSDAYDRDFALNLLSQEQDALYEIDEALKRLENGTYGTCEMSGKAIPHARLEAIPFARYTVECQADLEKQMRGQRMRRPVTSLFGLTDDEGSESDDDEGNIDNKE